MSDKGIAGGREIVLPMSKAVEISFRSLKIRFGRSLITTSGVVLAIAFLMSVWSSNEIVGSLRDVNKSEINLLLQKNGIETGIAESGEASAEAQARMQEERSKQTWLISLSLLVCVVGIANAMNLSPDPFLMSVAVGASCAFLTPIGHQCNALVLGPGGYRFGDYWRMGLPLEILILGAGTPLIMHFWPL